MRSENVIIKFNRTSKAVATFMIIFALMFADYPFATMKVQATSNSGSLYEYNEGYNYTENEKEQLKATLEDIANEEIQTESISENVLYVLNSTVGNLPITTVDQAIEIVRDGMVLRESTITVNYMGDHVLSKNEVEEIHQTIYKNVFLETDNSKEGDYLKWHFKNLVCKYTFNTQNITLTYSITYLSTAAEEEEVDNEINRLFTTGELSGIETKTDYQKTQMIYNYIIDNVSYDYSLSNYSCYNCLIEKEVVCQGIASSMYRLLREQGIKCRFVARIGENDSNNDHGWNIVEMRDGLYYYLDATWDLGRAVPKYFLVSKNEFTDINHILAAEYKTPAFETLYPMGDSPYVYFEEIDGHIHRFQGGSCIEPSICNICGAEGPYLGHTWVAATCTEAKRCLVCNITEGLPSEHTWVAVTCTKAKYCSGCNITEGLPLEHTWVAATCTEAKHCSVCNITEGSPLGHSYDKGVVTKAATAYEAGNMKYTCTRCGSVKNVAIPIILTPDITVSYRTHVQTYGWQDWKTNGAMSGTSGKAKRLEGIEIKVSGNNNIVIQYKTHVQSYGWQNWKVDGEMSGTSGEAKRLEAIQIELTGADKDKYDIYYRVHSQSFGWLDWAKNGERTGTAGLAKRLEGIEIRVLRKGDSAPGKTSLTYIEAGKSANNSSTDGLVNYSTHVQSYGNQSFVSDGSISGTFGEAKRLEGIKIQVGKSSYSGGIQYRTHIQTYGWETVWKANGEMSGTSGEAKRLEAIEIKLTGEIANYYNVYYRVHAQSYGWLGWAKNGESAGTKGQAKRLEAIQIVLIPKGQSAPGDTTRPFVE